MSYACVRGKPTAAQLYLDGILAEVIQEGGTGAARREGVSLSQILFHCLKKNPQDVLMINAVTGRKITNDEILKKAVSLARALLSKGARGKTVLIMMRNHETMIVVYLAVLFAGVVPFITDPSATVFEITHFLKLIEPCMVFCDEELYNNVNKAVTDVPIQTEVKVSNKEELMTEMTKGFSEKADGFLIPDLDGEATPMMLPTSGSTGLPKATMMTHRGIVVQLPMGWYQDTQFPTPTECCMLLTTPQWATFTMVVTSCMVYRVPILMSQRKPTVEWVLEMLVTYRPSWTFFGPAFVKTLLPTLTKDHFSSLKTLLVLGAPSTLEMMTALRDMLPPSASLVDAYGSTEAQGYVTSPLPDAPINSMGHINNVFHYKLVDDDGKSVGLGQDGELYIKGPSIFKGYYKSMDKYEESFEDGWFKTGDLFHIDEKERLYYLERKKFSFKHMGCHVSPEEVEQVIDSVPGVEESILCSTEQGPAAIVVARGVSREQIHKAVNDTLSEHKRLHGGIAFVEALPRTHSGKIHRQVCKTLVKELSASGELKI